jgi:alpha-ketoglutarate-dependent taurine dioxygenase
MSDAELGHAPGDPRHWRAEKTEPSAWRMTFPAEWHDEFVRLVQEFHEHPLPTLMRRVELHTLPVSRALMREVQFRLEHGQGLVVLSRLPMELCDEDDAIAVTWLLGQMLARPVATKFDGTMLFEVADVGGARGTETNLELSFHTDNAFGSVPPDYVSLLCMHPALEGGLSRFASLYSIHDELASRNLALLGRLYQPMHFHRLGAHLESAPRTLAAPMFSREGGQLRSRVAPGLVRRGYALLQQPMDAALEQALALVEEVLSRQELWIEFRLERGDLQIFNNQWGIHARTAFTDDPALPRRLVRTWYRDRGRQSYNG